MLMRKFIREEQNIQNLLQKKKCSVPLDDMIKHLNRLGGMKIQSHESFLVAIGQYDEIIADYECFKSEISSGYESLNFIKNYYTYKKTENRLIEEVSLLFDLCTYILMIIDITENTYIREVLFKLVLEIKSDANLYLLSLLAAS